MGFGAGKGKLYSPGDGLCRWREDLPSLIRLEVKNIHEGRFWQVNRLAAGARHHDDKSPGFWRRRWILVASVATCLKYPRQTGGAKLLDFEVGKVVSRRNRLADWFFPNLGFRRRPFYKI